MGVKAIGRKKNVNTDNYVNVNTGESLSSEYPNATSFNYYEQDLIMIDYSEYSQINHVSLRYVNTRFTASELGKIVLMSNMVKGYFNVLYDTNGKPHTKDTLMIALGYKKSMFAEFWKKLIAESIIATTVTDVRKLSRIMFNPFLARKGSTFERSCIMRFEDLSKKLIHTDDIDSFEKNK